ncbi:MAG: S26 family signal peptidase [Candidatus Saccharibacteria bacterium]
MVPTLRPNQIVIASGWFHSIDVGDVVILRRSGREQIKRVSELDPLKGVFVLGDNSRQSTDSRSFGWLDFDEILAKVIF